MSYDSDIAYYRRKRSELQNAIPNITSAIKDYNEALVELEKIKGVQRCIDFKVQIKLKISTLENEISTMRKKINDYTSKIASLKRAKASAEANASK